MRTYSKVIRQDAAKVSAVLLLSATSTLLAAAPANDATSSVGDVRIVVKIGDTVLQGTLAKNVAARDFAAQLPLDLTMDDLFGREKFARIPNPVSEAVQRKSSYSIGDIAYWSPKQDIAVYYRQDGETIPPPGLVPIGKFDGSVETFNVPGKVHIHIELAH
jgi:hypothetical protein